MEKKYKIIASDMDGTLLRNNKTISLETIQVLEKLDKEGVIFVPSTGRAHPELPEPILNLPFLKYGLCVNGGGVFDYKKEEYLFEVNIDYQTGIALLEFLKAYPVHPSLVIHGKRFLPCEKDGQKDSYIQKIAPKYILDLSTGVMDLIDFLKENKQGIQKFLLYPEKADQRDELIEIFSKEFPMLNICSSGPVFIEVNAQGVDKGKGLKFLCDYLGISLEDVIAFGDASNDIQLLQTAGHAVVMENGTEETKVYADEIAPSNEEDGLRKVLERIYRL